MAGVPDHLSDLLLVLNRVQCLETSEALLRCSQEALSTTAACFHPQPAAPAALG